MTAESLSNEPRHITVTQTGAPLNQEYMPVVEHFNERLDTIVAANKRDHDAITEASARDHDAIVATFDRHLQDAVMANQLALDAAREASNLALDAQKESVRVAMAASEKAVLKAEQLASQRADQQNEWRATIDDITQTKMPRTEVEAMIKDLTSRQERDIIGLSAQVTEITARINQQMMPRPEAEGLVKELTSRQERDIITLTTQVTDLTARMNQEMGGQTHSARQSSFIFAMVGMIVGVAGIIIALVSTR